MKFESINGVPVALGVDWFELPKGAERKKLIQKLQKTSRATHTLQLDLERTSHYGLASTRSHRKPPKKFASALAWFALSRPVDQGPEAIVWVQGDASKSQDLSNFRVWVGGVVDGAPMNRCDRLVRLADVSSTLVEMFGNRVAETSVYVVGFPQHNFGLFGEHVNQFRSFDETAIKSLFTNECPQQILMASTGLSPFAVGVVVALFSIIFFGGAAGGYLYWERIQEEERAAEEARRQAMLAAQPKPWDVYAQAFARLFMGGDYKYRASDVATNVYDSYKGTEDLEQGWSFSEVICSTKPLPGTVVAQRTQYKPQCQVELKRLPESAPVPSSNSRYPEIEKGVDGIKARRAFDAQRVLLDPNLTAEKLQEMFAPALAVDELLKQLRLAKDFGMTVTYQAPVKLPPEPGQIPPAATSTIEVKTGTWALSGPLQFYEVLHKFPPAAFIHTLRLTAEKNGLTFKAEGMYYVAESRPDDSAKTAPIIANTTAVK